MKIVQASESAGAGILVSWVQIVELLMAVIQAV